ncbi:hypothetical protein PUN28_010919 [Cardiocondyla obscurior]
MHPATTDMNVVRAGSRHSMEGGASSSNSAGSSPVTGTTNGMLTPKIEDVKPEVYNNEVPRQTVLMWGAPPQRTPPRNNGSYSPPTPHSTHSSTHSTNTTGDPLKSLAEMNSINGDCKWRQTSPTDQQVTAPSPPRNNKTQQSQHQQQYPVTTSQYQTAAVAAANTIGYNTHSHPGPGGHGEPGSEVWQGVQHHHHYQYYPYHHHHPAPPRHTPQLQHATVSCGNGDGGGNRHGHGHRGGQQHQQQQQRLVPPSAPPPPPRSGIISGGNGGNGPNCPTDSKPDAGSPLLSISEVTNTLLNQ